MFRSRDLYQLFLCFVVVLVCFFSGCLASQNMEQTGADASDQPTVPETLVERVIEVQQRPKVKRALIIGIDGVRPDALLKAKTPNLDRLRERGHWTLNATTQLTADTKSGPGWASVLTGVEATKHNIVSNSNFGQRELSYPTFLYRLKKSKKLKVAVMSGWLLLLGLIESDAMDLSLSGKDSKMATEMAQRLKERSHDLHMIHFDNVDHAGHSKGFSPDVPDYIQAIEETDVHVGTLLSAIENSANREQEEWLIVVTTDHGGEGKDHGPRNDLNRRIFFIVAKDQMGSQQLPTGVSHMDVHPTVLSFWGLSIEPGWKLDGKSRGF